MGGCGTIQARLVPESWMHIYKETHTAPLMSFCFTEEHSVWSWKRLASGILYKRWTGTQCSGRLRGSRDLPTGLGQAMLRGEQSSMDMTSHLVGVGGLLGTLADDEQEEKANPEAAVRRLESFWDQKRVVRKACEPLSEVRECWSVHLPPSFPSLHCKWSLYFDFRCGTNTDIMLSAFQM